MTEIDLAPHESMGPMLMDEEGLGEQMDVAMLIAAAHEHHGALERGTQIELETFGEPSPLRGEISPRGGLGPVGRDITGGVSRQGFDVWKVVAPPNLGLPQRIEAFDGILILEARLARWGELHGGKVGVQSGAARTAFTLCFPQAR